MGGTEKEEIEKEVEAKQDDTNEEVKEEIQQFKGERQVIEICCRAVNKLKKFVAEHNDDYKKLLKDNNQFDHVMNEICGSVEAQNQKDGTKTETKNKKNLKEEMIDTLKFKLTEAYSDKACEIMDKNFSFKIIKFTDIQNCSGNSLKAIERAMRLMDEAEVKLSSSSADKFRELFQDKLELDDYKCIKKLLSNDTAGPLPEDDPVHKAKSSSKNDKKQAKSSYSADDCVALVFIDIFKSFKTALSRKKASDFMDCLMKILEFFPFLSELQQKESIKIIETASKQISISDLMFNHPKQEYLYYCICFEYILESQESETIKLIYDTLKSKESVYEIKRFREQFITALLDYQKHHESTPIYVQLGQRIVSFLIDETLSFGYKNAADIEKKARSFWAEICRGDPIVIANSFYSLLGYLKNNSIRLSESDLQFCRHNVFENYIKIKFEELPVIHKVEISEESEYTHVPDHLELLSKFEVMFESIPTKKQKKDNAEEYKFTNYSNEKIKELNESIAHMLKNEKSLTILENHITEIYNTGLVSNSDYKNLNKILNRIQTILNNNEYIVEEYGRAKVENFGSSSNSLWSMDSDIDVVIEFIKGQDNTTNNKDKKKNSKNKLNKNQGNSTSKKEQIKNFDYIQALKDIRGAIRKLSVNGEIEGVFNSRVPLLKFKEINTNIDIDISINNTIGVPNSRMTKLYCEFDQRVHIMITYLRYLFKRAGLLHGDQGSLTSYCIILMVIAFLQSQEEPILPNLQADVKDKSSKVFYSINKNKFGRVDCKEIKADINEDLAELQKTFKSKNTKSVAQLVIEFLQFYFLDPERAKPIIDIRQGGFVNGETDKLALFDIVEPLGHNSKVGLGCHKDSNHAESYTKFAYEYCKNLIAQH